MSNMLAVQNSPQFITRIFTDQTGRQFRMVFLVAVVAGEIKGRLVSVEPLSDSFKAQEIVLCLPISYPKVEGNTEYVAAFSPVVSPYFSLDFLINSQPTRAPSSR